MYQAACASSATRTVAFSGITRPVPASVFDLPTVSCFLWTRSICRHRSSRSSLSRSPQFRSTTRAGYMFLLRSLAASASMRAFSSAVYARPGDGGRASFIAFSRRNFARIRSPWSPHSRSSNSHLVVDGLRAGLLSEAICLVAFYDRRRDLDDESATEVVRDVAEGIFRERCGFVFGL